MAGGRGREAGRWGGGGIMSGWGVAEEGTTLNLVSTTGKNKNPFQKLQWAQCLILIVVTSGDLFPFQTISWVF